MSVLNEVVARKFSPIMVHEFTIDLDEDMNRDEVVSDLKTALEKAEEMSKEEIEDE